jgi:hypothetical protein
MPLFIHSFIHQWFCSPLLGPGLLFCSVIFVTKEVGLLGRVISPSQGRYLHTGQHKHRINAHTDIHALSGIRTHDSSIRASEDSSSLRPRSHRDRPFFPPDWINIWCVLEINFPFLLKHSKCIHVKIKLFLHLLPHTMIHRQYINMSYTWVPKSTLI